MQDSLPDPTYQDLASARGELQCFEAGCHSRFDYAVVIAVLGAWLLILGWDVLQRGWRAFIDPTLSMAILYIIATSSAIGVVLRVLS